MKGADKFSRRDFLSTTAALGMGLGLPQFVGAQGKYPEKAVKVLVGFAPGGGTDIIGRLVSQSLNEQLGQPFVVENRSGAGGNIATLAATTAPADGYTLLVTTIGQVVVSPHTDPKLKFNPLTDLQHITMLGEGDYILAVHPSVPAKDIHELIALIKRNPGKYNYGTAGAGSNLHLFTEYFMRTAGLQVEAIHYRGGAALTPDLLSGQVHISLNGYFSFEPHIKAGKLRPLLVLGKQREARLPDIPTAKEIGMPELEVCTNWFGLHAPANTPAPIIQQLNVAANKFLQTPAAKEKLAGMSMRPMGDSPEGFVARIQRDYKLFGEIARSTNVQMI